jgi:hypothetical protein
MQTGLQAIKCAQCGDASETGPYLTRHTFTRLERVGA